jgi:hypothetical protein
MDPKQPRFAPCHAIGDSSIVSLEHPCFIQNVDRGIASLGGQLNISNVRFQ